MNLNRLFKAQFSTNTLLQVAAITALIGLADAIYLTSNYYFGSEVQCLVTRGCAVVLASKYSSLAGIPLAVVGLVFYAGMFLLINAVDIYRKEFLFKVLVVGGAIGFVVSMALLYTQLFVLEALCFYCLISLISSTMIFVSVTIILVNSDYV